MTHEELMNLPFEEVEKLYYQKLLAEKNNDIKLRTKLLNEYPSLFDPESWEEIANVFRLLDKRKDKPKHPRPQH